MTSTLMTHCAAEEEEAITAFVSSVIKNAMVRVVTVQVISVDFHVLIHSIVHTVHSQEREAAKNFVSEVFFSAFLRTAESDVAVKTGTSNSYELNTVQALVSAILCGCSFTVVTQGDREWCVIKGKIHWTHTLLVYSCNQCLFETIASLVLCIENNQVSVLPSPTIR